MKKLTILGATGSIGMQTLQICDAYPDKLEVSGLSAANNWQKLAELSWKYRPKFVAIADNRYKKSLQEALTGSGVTVWGGCEGVVELAAQDCDLVVGAISGMAGLKPVLTAIECGHDLALANKETLVAGGNLVMPLAAKKQLNIYPVDSEHSALWQCLRGESPGKVNRLILTASGGPFQGKSADYLAKVTPQMALKHPNWDMGAKVTIDSATMVNKGLEIIEAHWLFDMPYEKIEAIVHPESIIHSLVEFADYSIKAQLAHPDMRLPIQYAIFFPERIPCPVDQLSLDECLNLHFSRIDKAVFPGPDLAKQAGMAGGAAPVVFNAANEELVGGFLDGKIGFCDISQGIERVMDAYISAPANNYEEIIAADKWARDMVLRMMKNRWN